MNRTSFATVSVLAVACCAFSCATTPEQTGPATPKRIEGLTEPTITERAPAYSSPAELRQLVEAAAEARTEFLRKFPPPELKCHYVTEKIHIDGRLDERAWQQAPLASNFRLTRELTPARLDTRARLLWGDKYLYIGFQCPDTDIIATLTKRDGDLWMEDVVEVFIDANGDEMSYIELELSPRNVLYDASVADYRPEILWSNDLQHLDIYYGIKIYDAPDIRSAVYIDGTLNDSTDVDRGWSCEMAISWKDIARGTNIVRVPPEPGDVWRIGLYRININTDKGNNPDEYAAWNPTTSWFHVTWAFGRVIFTREVE